MMSLLNSCFDTLAARAWRNRHVRRLTKQLLRTSGYRLVPDSVPRTHAFGIHQLADRAVDRDWQQLMMYVTAFDRSKDLPGDIAEFGVASGTSFKAFVRLNEIHNRRRPHDLCKKRVYGFDTFKGLPAPHPEIDLVTYGRRDPGDLKAGGYGSENLLPELKEFCGRYPDCQLIEGPFSTTLPEFITRNPHVSFSLIHIDCDLYESTCEALMPVLNRLNVGGVILFDEIFHRDFPGETQAFVEVYERFRETITLQFARVESLPWKWYCVRTR